MSIQGRRSAKWLEQRACKDGSEMGFGGCFHGAGEIIISTGEQMERVMKISLAAGEGRGAKRLLESRPLDPREFHETVGREATRAKAEPGSSQWKTPPPGAVRLGRLVMPPNKFFVG